MLSRASQRVSLLLTALTTGVDSLAFAVTRESLGSLNIILNWGRSDCPPAIRPVATKVLRHGDRSTAPWFSVLRGALCVSVMTAAWGVLDWSQGLSFVLFSCFFLDPGFLLEMVYLGVRRVRTVARYRTHEFMFMGCRKLTFVFLCI